MTHTEQEYYPFPSQLKLHSWTVPVCFVQRKSEEALYFFHIQTESEIVLIPISTYY
jgi:hypothetical protein